MIADSEALIGRHIDLCWEEEAARARIQTETHIARELHRLTQRGIRNDDGLRGVVARALRSEGISLAVRRLQISLKTIAEAHHRITLDQMNFIETGVRATFKEWIAHRTPYLEAKLQSISAEPFDRLLSETFWEVTRVVERELEITRARFLLAMTSPEEGASAQDFSRAHILQPEARDLIPDPELADRLALLDSSLADSYLQVVSDLSQPHRISYLGPLAELQAIITGLLPKLAPDHQVSPWLADMSEAPDNGGGRPSRAQTVRFIIYQHSPIGNGNPTARALDNLLDNMLPGFISNWYRRALSGHPADSGRDEAIRIFRYADSLLRELLPPLDHTAPPHHRALEHEPPRLHDSLLKALHPS